ncbi:hypothetical protein RDWZM_002102 [Blomia tropicalis]|uniref:Uncharacterized protein n=1 Tax=Blomia tropicalis TaxID=40697 RepID=A0A9Q0MFH4_BLOTA|nr:hypothetical protein RDWZM_002102 [Blomia tropicalis]
MGVHVKLLNDALNTSFFTMTTLGTAVFGVELRELSSVEPQINSEHFPVLSMDKNGIVWHPSIRMMLKPNSGDHRLSTSPIVFHNSVESLSSTLNRILAQQLLIVGSQLALLRAWKCDDTFIRITITTVFFLYTRYNIVIGCTLSTYSMLINPHRTYPGENLEYF